MAEGGGALGHKACLSPRLASKAVIDRQHDKVPSGALRPAGRLKEKAERIAAAGYGKTDRPVRARRHPVDQRIGMGV